MLYPSRMHPHPLRFKAFLGVLVFAAGTAARPAGQDATVRTGIDLLTLDFRVLDRTGAPVADLQPGEVVVRLGGREREIKSLQYVRLAGHPGRTDAAASADLPPPFGTNYPGDAGRAVILVVENDSLRASIARHTIDAVSAFVGTLGPRDRVALLTTPRGGLLADLSRDHRRVRELLAGISGQASERTSESEKACRTRDTLNALTGLLEGLAHLETPKTIVFVSGGMLTPRRDAPLAGPPGPCELRPVNYDEVGKAAIETRANFYVIKADDLVIDSAANAFADPAASRFRSSDEELAGMESLAGVTSGTFLRTSPSDDSAFRRVALETAGYYVAAVEPERGERNGLSHRVDISVTRPNLTVRARPRIVISKPATGTSQPSRTPQAMLRDGRTYRDLPLRAAAFASASPSTSLRAGPSTSLGASPSTSLRAGAEAEQLKIVAVAEPLDELAAIASAAFGLIDARGKLVAQWTANERELARVPVASAGLAAPGTYRLRVAAIDAAGRRGAADYEFEAAIVPAGPLKLSTLVMGVSRGGFTPRLIFGGEPTAMGFFELYGAVNDASTLSVMFELSSGSAAEPLESSIRVPGVVTVTREPDLRRASGVVPLGALAPGDYLVRAIVSLDGRPIGEVERTLRKAFR